MKSPRRIESEIKHLQKMLKESIRQSDLNKRLEYEDQLDFKRWVLENYPQVAAVSDDPFYFDYVTGVDARDDKDIPHLACDGSLTWGDAAEILMNYFTTVGESKTEEKKKEEVREVENPDDAKMDDLDIKGDEYEKQRAEEEKLKKDASLKESENAFDSADGLTTYYCRDLIWGDAPDDVEVAELPYMGKYASSNRCPISLTEEDYQKVVKNSNRNNNEYRVFAYYIKGKAELKWSEYGDEIEDKIDFENFIDPEWHRYQDYPEEWNPEFAKTFPKYEDWVAYIGKNAAEELRYSLAHSGKLPYESMADGDEIKINEDGTAYILIAWRA